MAALREKYLRMQRDQQFESTPAGNNEYDIKMQQEKADNVVKEQRRREEAAKAGGGESPGPNDPPRMAFQSAKLDNLLICGRCAGLGIMKRMYNNQETQINCDECTDGLIEKVKNKFPPKQVNDIPPVETKEEEMELQQQLLTLVRLHFKDRPSQMQEFFLQTRDYGTTDVSANVYMGHIMENFGGKTQIVLPILVRLLKDKDKRMDLLRAQHREIGVSR
jgi:hypothetical protein